MPNGRCHSAATISTASVFLTYWGTGAAWAIFAALGAFTGLVVEPDLDQDYQAAPLGTMRQTGGDTVAKLWQLYWTPYARLIPHRSMLSHGPIIGTLGRMVYMLPIYGLPLAAWTYYFGFPYAAVFAYAVGLMWCDIMHFVMDFMVPHQLFPQNPYRR